MADIGSLAFALAGTANGAANVMSKAVRVALIDVSIQHVALMPFSDSAVLV